MLYLPWLVLTLMNLRLFAIPHKLIDYDVNISFLLRLYQKSQPIF